MMKDRGGREEATQPVSTVLAGKERNTNVHVDFPGEK